MSDSGYEVVAPGLSVPGDVVLVFVAAFHLVLAAGGIVLWRKEAPRALGLTHEEADITAKMGAQQGFYNGIIAAGLLFGLADDVLEVKTIFLGSAVGAGVFAGLTVSARVAVVQAGPALVAFAFCSLGGQNASDAGVDIIQLAVVVILSAGIGHYVQRREAALDALTRAEDDRDMLTASTFTLP